MIKPLHWFSSFGCNIACNHRHGLVRYGAIYDAARGFLPAQLDPRPSPQHTMQYGPEDRTCMLDSGLVVGG